MQDLSIKPRHSLSRWVTCALFFFCAAVFYSAPMHRIEDSQYSLLVSRDIIDYGSVDLSRYGIPKHAPNARFGVMPNGYTYHLYPIGSRLYLFFPLGSSVLSLPVVWIAGHFGISPVKLDGTYNSEGEAVLEVLLASMLCATTVCLFFQIGLLWLPTGYSVLLALIGGFCTPILSTASRALWSHTWLILILTVSIYILCRAIKLAQRPNIILLATCVAWIYFIRPTGSVSVLGITALTYMYVRERFILFAFTGAIWAAAFILFSKLTYGTLLPPYYLASRISGSSTFLEAFAGNMLSPARGWLVYTPCLLVFGALPKYARTVREKWLLITAIGVMLLQWLAISEFPHWWGGFSYGPRLMTDCVPWLFISFVMLTDSYLKSPVIGYYGIATKGLCVTVLIFVLFVNVGGAFGKTSITWNNLPTSIDDNHDRIWSWRHAQFFAAPYLAPNFSKPTPET